MAQVRARFRTPEVIARVNRATKKNLDRVTLWIEGRAKVNIQSNGQIDTGFMLNATYSVLSEGQSTYTQVQRSGDNGQEIAPQASAGDKNAVCNGARYAIYQEAAQSFLYQAGVQAVQALGPGMLTAIREELDDG